MYKRQASKSSKKPSRSIMPAEVLWPCSFGARPKSIVSGSPSQMESSRSAKTSQTGPFDRSEVAKSASDTAQPTIPARKRTPVTPFAEKSAAR